MVLLRIFIHCLYFYSSYWLVKIQHNSWKYPGILHIKTSSETYILHILNQIILILAQAYKEIFCLFCQIKLSWVQWLETTVPSDFFFHPNFVKPYQSSKAPSSCLRAGKIFIRHEIAQIYQFTGHILKENVIQENLILLFQCKSFWQKAAKRLNFHAAIKPLRWTICISGCCMMIST